MFCSKTAFSGLVTLKFWASCGFHKKLKAIRRTSSEAGRARCGVDRQCTPSAAASSNRAALLVACCSLTRPFLLLFVSFY